MCVGVVCHECVQQDPHTEHICHHIYQICYEFVVFAVAVILAKDEFELFGILLGLAGSCAGLARFFRADVYLNSGAALAAIVSLSVVLPKLGQCEIGFEGVSAIFSLYVLVIRISSVLHAFVEMCETGLIVFFFLIVFLKKKILFLNFSYPFCLFI